MSALALALSLVLLGDSRALNLKQPDGVHTSEPERWLRAALDAAQKRSLP